MSVKHLKEVARNEIVKNINIYIRFKIYIRCTLYKYHTRHTFVTLILSNNIF